MNILYYGGILTIVAASLFLGELANTVTEAVIGCLVLFVAEVFTIVAYGLISDRR